MLPNLNAMQFNFANIKMELQFGEDGKATMVFTPVVETELVAVKTPEQPAAPAAPAAPATIHAQPLATPTPPAPPADPTAAAAAFLAGNVPPAAPAAPAFPAPTPEQTAAALAEAQALLNS